MSHAKGALCPRNQRWNDDALTALLDHACKELRVDASRLYLTGLSMGGYGSWSLGLKLCDRFAAISVIRVSERRGGGQRIGGY